MTPDDPEAYFNRGQAYMQAYNSINDNSYIDLCIADFNQVIAFDDQNAESYFNRGLCQSFKQNLVRAFEDFSKAIELNPEGTKYFIQRALLFPILGTSEQALADAQKALELSKEEDLTKIAEGLIKEIPTLPTPTPGPSPTPFE